MSNVNGLSDLENNNSNNNSTRQSSASQQSGQLGNFDQKGRFNPWMRKSPAITTGYAQLAEPTTPGNQLSSSFSSVTGVEIKLKTFSTINLIVIWTVFVVCLLYKVISEREFGCILYDFGALYQPSVTYLYHFHRLFLPGFLHANFMHIISNSIGLFLYSYILENRYGTKKYIAYYILCGFGGHLLSGYHLSKVLSVGASASIYGLFPFMFVYVLENPQMARAQKSMFAVYIFLQVIASFLPQKSPASGTTESPAQDIIVNNAAHLGGLVTGVLICACITQNEDIPKRFRCTLKTWQIGMKVILGCLLAGFFFYNQFNFSIPEPNDLIRTCQQ